MTNWYRRVIVPRLLNMVMASERLEKIRHEVLETASGIVLEIGIGPGYNLPIYQNILKLYALEPSQELIDIARPRADARPFPVEFLKADAECIPLPDHWVDTVVSTWTLCSVIEPKKVLQEIKRVLRPQGKFIFVDHGASPHPGVLLAQRVFTSVTKYFTGNCHFDREIEGLIREAGFSMQNIKHPRERFKPLIYNYQGIVTRDPDA